MNKMMKLYAKIPMKEVIYKGKIKRTGTGQGYIYMNDEYLGCRAYIIIPQKYEFDGADYYITIDEVMNKGVHPDNDHTCRIFLSRSHLGRECFVIIDDDMR